MIAQHDQIFLTMPAKAAGTSMKDFVKRCLPNSKKNPDNFVNYPDKTKSFLTSSFKLPPVIASHMLTDQALIDLMQHASSDLTLLVYIHRSETDRLLSAIRQVLASLVCDRKTYKIGDLKRFHMERNATHCILNEGPAVELIERRVAEIGIGSFNVLSCRAYEVMKETAPNLVLLNYQQAGKLQQLLAKKYCPDVDPKRSNDGLKKTQVYLRLENHKNKKEQQIVKLSDWLQIKRNLLEWTLKLKSNATCQAKTKEMERRLSSCPDEAMQLVFPSTTISSQALQDIIFP